MIHFVSSSNFFPSPPPILPSITPGERRGLFSCGLLCRCGRAELSSCRIYVSTLKIYESVCVRVVAVAAQHVSCVLKFDAVFSGLLLLDRLAVEYAPKWRLDGKCAFSYSK